MKIIIDENIPYARKLFEQYGDVQLLSGRDITCDILKSADALIVRSVTKVNHKLLVNTAVKFVGTVTSGVDHIDQDYLLSSSIAFFSAIGCNAIAVVEYVFSALLWLANRENFFLRDKVVGIVGVGNIGTSLHKRLEFFGVSTLLYDPLIDKQDGLVNFCSFEKVVAESDILTFHVPLVLDGQYTTWHMVNDDLLASLADFKVLINTSRGAVFDNLALLKVLKGGKKLNVVLDVWENEPNLLLPLLQYVDLATPHIAGSTIEGRTRGVMLIFDAYKNFFGIVEDKCKSYAPCFPSITDYFEIDEDVDQEILFCLSNVVYDVNIDNIILRYSIDYPNSFDMLRKLHRNRKEWSSICIKSSSHCFAKKFNNLGFSVCSV